MSNHSDLNCKYLQFSRGIVLDATLLFGLEACSYSDRRSRGLRDKSLRRILHMRARGLLFLLHHGHGLALLRASIDLTFLDEIKTSKNLVHPFKRDALCLWKDKVDRYLCNESVISIQKKEAEGFGLIPAATFRAKSNQ